MRVIHGLPVSWDTYTAATTRPSRIALVAWSPCGKFIAISAHNSTTADIIDSVILLKLQHLEFEFPKDGVRLRTLIFSPDGRRLTSSCENGMKSEVFVVSWDLQIGGVAGVIRWKSQMMNCVTHIAYSTTGRMVAVLRQGHPTTVSICDVVSCEHLRDVRLPNNPISCSFRSHGESLRVATFGRTTSEASGVTPSITVWEFGFTAGTLTEVETLPVPESAYISDLDGMHFPQSTIHPQHPQAPRSAVLLYRTPHVGILVWDAQNSKVLLHQSGNYLGHSTFSSDGRFFAYSTDTEVHLWKYSPTGYVLHGKLAFPTEYFTPHLSPNGELMIVFGSVMISLWHTRNLLTATSDGPAKPAPRIARDFVLEFHPDRPLAVVARQGDSTVTLLDLDSGASLLTINTGTLVQGLGVAGETIVVIENDGATTWKLPGEDLPTGSTVGPLDYIRAVGFKRDGHATTRVLSPDSRYIAAMESGTLSIRCTTTGEYLCGDKAKSGALWFTPDSRSVGCVIGGDKAWVQEIKTVTTGGTLQHQLGEGVTVDIGQRQWGCPYKSSHGYQVVDNHWIFGPSGKLLLILPPLWRLRSFRYQWKWNGRFLALLHGSLPEPVILELEP